MKQKFYSNGKLLLTGEYLVLDGASALAIPTCYGQSMVVEEIEESALIWESLDEKGDVWFKDLFSLVEIQAPLNKRGRKETEFSKSMIQVLKEVKKLNPKFLNTKTGYKVTTKLDFPRDWGLGSSSTLINNIAKWAKVDAYTLLEKTFGGSGYDIAAAQNNTPISYTIINAKPTIKEINLQWDFTNQLFFVHLNKKQNSREGIKHYQSNSKVSLNYLNEISEITSQIINCKSILEFEVLINRHEQIISNIISQKPVKELLFKDYKGAVKSLGAWGGDFILATGGKEGMDYFRKKGFETIILYRDMIK